MKIVGIDPGKAGAIAWLDTDAVVGLGHDARVTPMPVLHSVNGRDEYDLHTLKHLFEEGNSIDLIFIERQQALPSKMGGGLANYGRGYIQGVLEGLLTGIRRSYQLVTPRRWQADMLAGIPGIDTKVRSIICAQRRFPHIDLRRTSKSRVPDSGFADALNIAEWGARRQRK